MELFEDSSELFSFVKSVFKNYKQINDNELSIEVDGEANTYNLKIEWLSESCEIYIEHYGTSPKNSKCALRLYEYLLKANASMAYIYFSVLEDNRPELKSRLSLEGLNSSLVQKVLEYIVMYADTHYFNVLNLANNEQAKIITEEDNE